MPKTKRRATARKKSAKRGKASVKSARKKTTTPATAKRAKSKAGRVAKRLAKPTAEEKPAFVETKPIVAEPTVETSVAAAIATPSVSSEGEDKPLRPDISSDLADIGSDLGELPEQKVA
jgi:hypothetical protein